MDTLARRKKLVVSIIGFIFVSCIGGCFAVVRYVDAQDREYWEEFTPQQAAQWVQREPDNISARAVYGMHLWNQKDYDKAIIQFRSEAKLDPHDHSPHDHIAEILEEQGNMQEAQKERNIAEQLGHTGSLVQQKAQSNGKNGNTGRR